MGTKRAYSLLNIKSIDEDQRVIEGIATTPKTDRMDDIVEPKGAVFALPIPFLWQHDSRSPVGHVIKASITDKGISVTVQLAKSDNPGPLKDLLDRAWESIKLKLVRGLSIGFNLLESANIEGSWGLHITRWEWLELSAVTIPANIDASIQTVKSHDSAASGHSNSPGVSGLPVRLSTPKPRGQTVKTISDQIKSFENERAAKEARRTELMSKAGETGETLDSAGEEEYDTLTGEIESIDKHLVRLRALEKSNVEKAKAVSGAGSEAGSESRSPVVRLEAPETLEKGIEFARFVMCVAAAKGDVPQSLALARRHYPQQKRAIDMLKAAADLGMSVGAYAEGLMRAKANVVAATTSDATWAAPLLGYTTFAGDFLDFLRARTIIGQFGQNGVPGLLRIPFNVHIKGQTSGGTGYWVGQGKPKPVTKFDFNDTYHSWNKVAALAVLTEEIIRFSDPSAERLVRDALSGALIERIDETFIDPTAAAVSGVSPASITNGVSAISASGTDADAVRADIAALWAAAIAANLPMTDAVYITTPALAQALSLMMNPLGQREFPDINMLGGRLLGVPVIVSNYVTAGDLILAFASEIYLSDDDAVTIDASREASIQMLDNPTNDSVTPTPTAMVSMFQTNSVALRAERFITWSKRRTSAVARVSGADYGSFGS